MTQGCSPETPKLEAPSTQASLLLTKQTNYNAGDTITLRFKSNQKTGSALVVRNALGSSLLEPVMKEGLLEFQMPPDYSQKAGICRWEFVTPREKSISGTLQIAPNTTEETLIESYLGPRSITAGNIDFSMFVIVPTDIYDNTFADGTDITVKHQFKETIFENEIEIKNSMAWTKIGTTAKAGRILVTASCNHTDSKELTTLVYPSNAIDFTITSKRDHQYADGNQIITFSSSVITDQFNNIISDGTLVSFLIEDKTGNLLQTSGSTLNGIATAKLLHPVEEQTWKVTAYITGIAKSNTITIDFEAAVKDYTISFPEDKRTVFVGPIKSFMNQDIPDGLVIQLAIYNSQSQLLETKMTTSKNGLAKFRLPPDFFENGIYHLQIKSAGITKNITVVLK
ncbi:putative secreted protein (Por secretion system target) [Maribacter polysiphoniae]|nr:putative secreted protein (Por secretion system target) [Maribacter polysiphoniae]